MRIPFEVTSNRKKLMGIIHLPSYFAQKKIFVILCYGMNGNRVEANRMFVKAANFFEKKGIAFVRFDYSGLAMSDGDFYEANIDTKVTDVINIISFVRNCCVNESCRIVLMGISDGAKVINQIMSIKLVDIDSVILLNPVLALDKTEQENKSEENVEKSKNVLSIVTHPIFGKKAILNVGQFFSPKHMKQCSVNQEIFDVSDKKVISFFAAQDDLSLLTRKRIEKTSCTIKEIASCSHVFAESEAQLDLFEKVVNWIFEIERIR